MKEIMRDVRKSVEVRFLHYANQVFFLYICKEMIIIFLVLLYQIKNLCFSYQHQI
jgi:hypothetical protein